jgi:hypothetical protein
VRVIDVIHALLDQPMDATVYIGKGVGPLGDIDYKITDRIYVILSPVRAS